MNLLQKAERAIRSIQLVFWGAVIGLVLGTVLGTFVTRYWYTTLARPGPGEDGSSHRVVISPPAVPGPGRETQKSTTKNQGIEIMVKGHAKGPARLAKSATQPQEVPISTGEGKSPQADQIDGLDPRIPGPEGAKIDLGSTVGGTVDEAVLGDALSSGNQVSPTAEAAREEQPAETAEATETAEAAKAVEITEMTTAAPAAPETTLPPVAFHVGDRAEGTVEGSLEIVDSRGRPITTEPLRISGEYTLDFTGPGQAELDLRFTAPAVMAIEAPPPAVKNRTIYLSASTGWLADRPFAVLSVGYGRRWPLLGGLSARAEVEAGWAWTPNKDGPFVRAGVALVYEF